MSLWLQSLESCLSEFPDNREERAKCILAHLSMKVPRSWWEQALQTGTIPQSHMKILEICLKNLNELSAYEFSDISLLVALAFIDEERGNQNGSFGNTYSKHSLEEYIFNAKRILANNPDVQRLDAIIKQNK